MKFTLIADIHLGPEKLRKGVYRKLTRHSKELTDSFVQSMKNKIKAIELSGLQRNW